jgi:hypothetical protein
MARGQARAQIVRFSNKGDRPTPLCEALDAAYLRSQVREWDRDGRLIRHQKEP